MIKRLRKTNTSGKPPGWFAGGHPWVWLNAGAVSVCVIMVVGLLGLIAARGMGHFWPAAILQATYSEKNGTPHRVIGEIVDEESVPATRLRDGGHTIIGEQWVKQVLLKVGNRDVLGNDFRWALADNLIERSYPVDLMVLERREWGNAYGYLLAVQENGKTVAEGAAAWPFLQDRLQRVEKLYAELHEIEKDEIGAINYQLEQLRLAERRLELDQDNDATKRAAIAAQRVAEQQRYEALQEKLTTLRAALARDSLRLRIMDDQVVDIPLEKIVRAVRPNAMNVGAKIGHYFVKLWEFLSDEPREANTEGGIFPAIFGTVMLVLVMSMLVTPFGIVAAVYLREYAKQGVLTRIIRIAVNNLAGVPAIVYGVFGLGFFVYFVGGNIDQWFFSAALPHPTFGTPGILWSSLTLALLTVPVVIVATEEGLSRVPRAIREGSLALGATKAETLWRTVLPMATPAMMTGLILAIARAAGEVAPLMLVGVVKLAPSLPLDENFPYVHLDRKFMHLGFHIYDVGFQSPNVEAARPLVYATALLLVLIIVLLNLVAIALRNRLREKYRALES